MPVLAIDRLPGPRGQTGFMSVEFIAALSRQFRTSVPISRDERIYESPARSIGRLTVGIPSPIIVSPHAIRFRVAELLTENCRGTVAVARKWFSDRYFRNRGDSFDWFGTRAKSAMQGLRSFIFRLPAEMGCSSYPIRFSLEGCCEDPNEKTSIMRFGGLPSRSDDARIQLNCSDLQSDGPESGRREVFAIMDP